MAKEITKCHHCGAKMVQYPFNFSKGLAACLRRMEPYLEEPVEIRTLGLTSSQWTNFQKLRYWGFIQPYKQNEDRKGGWWFITQKGRDFLAGKISIHKRVWMYRNSFVRYDCEPISVWDVVDGYAYKPDYIEGARPVLNHEPPDVFEQDEFEF